MQALFSEKSKNFVHVVAGNGTRTVFYGAVKLFLVVHARTHPGLYPARTQIVERLAVFREKAGTVCVGIRVYRAFAEVLLRVVNVLLIFIAVFCARKRVI